MLPRWLPFDITQDCRVANPPLSRLLRPQFSNRATVSSWDQYDAKSAASQPLLAVTTLSAPMRSRVVTMSFSPLAAATISAVQPVLEQRWFTGTFSPRISWMARPSAGSGVADLKAASSSVSTASNAQGSGASAASAAPLDAAAGAGRLAWRPLTSISTCSSVCSSTGNVKPGTWRRGHRPK